MTIIQSCEDFYFLDSTLPIWLSRYLSIFVSFVHLISIQLFLAKMKHDEKKKLDPRSGLETSSPVSRPHVLSRDPNSNPLTQIGCVSSNDKNLDCSRETQF